MIPSRPDVVFDCNVLLQAISRENGPAAAALRLADANRIALHFSKPILRELRRTLAYPELRQRNPHITDERVNAFIAHLLFRGILTRGVPRMFELPRDPHDEPYLDLAAAIDADYLVTRDNDLLSLATEHSPEAKSCRQQRPQMRIVTPVDFLAAFRPT